ncbi:MAG TPA: hypothetical protein VNQ33_01620 [Acidimicrobiales bacterium]|nr:hypothetical protein [Acidimicrobiales bacterium]
MTANPIRRRAVRVVTAVALSLVVLSGCTTAQHAPKSYAGVEDDFLEGCVKVAESDNQEAQAKTTEIASPQSYCQCVFDAIEKKIPYSDFKKAQSTMQDEGGKIPAKFIDAYESCDPAAKADS